VSAGTDLAEHGSAIRQHGRQWNEPFNARHRPT
jgi:hypothetical protein